jgi:hypothetical protein
VTNGQSAYHYKTENVNLSDKFVLQNSKANKGVIVVVVSRFKLLKTKNLKKVSIKFSGERSFCQFTISTYYCFIGLLLLRQLPVLQNLKGGTKFFK